MKIDLYENYLITEHICETGTAKPFDYVNGRDDFSITALPSGDAALGLQGSGK